MSDSPLVEINITSPEHAPETIRISQKEGPPPEPEIVDGPGAFGYSGRHDGGELHPEKEEPSYSYLLEALERAKQETDDAICKLGGLRPKDMTKSTRIPKGARKLDEERLKSKVRFLGEELRGVYNMYWNLQRPRKE